MSSNKTRAWQELAAHSLQMANVQLTELFSQDASRASKFSCEFEGLFLDYSKQHVNAQTIQLLLNLAKDSNLRAAIQDLFDGQIVNKTEQRQALHTELRNPNTKRNEIKQSLQQMQDFVQMVNASAFTDVLVLGIGGSDLGPQLVCQALKPYKNTNKRLHFISNVDADTLLPTITELNPQTTLCLINSKTFTTIETLSNAKVIQAWMQNSASENIWAITANPGNAERFGVRADHIFLFWDWVGGRYSVWSAVGLSIALWVGMDNFKRFLHGAHQMDQHFLHAEFSQNLPVLLALIGIWQINFRNLTTLCIQPYLDGLELIPAYLQQLEMESNGKHANYHTAPIIWGGVGCNAQHAYMQMLHQGTQVVPVDFFVARQNHNQSQELQRLLVASALGQAQALMRGKQSTDAFKTCPGNRPSNVLMFDKLTPETMGQLLALYEHKVYVQGVIWQIDSFDQWGVQLGKELITDILHAMDSKGLEHVDASTAALLARFLKPID